MLSSVEHEFLLPRALKVKTNILNGDFYLLSHVIQA